MEDTTANVPQPKPATDTSATMSAHAPAAMYSQALDAYLAKKKADKVDVTLVDVVVPKSFTLVIEGHVRIVVPQGYQKMPVEWTKHWWSQANGVAAKDALEEAPKDDKGGKGGKK